jgi:hypothetical protein
LSELDKLGINNELIDENGIPREFDNNFFKSKYFDFLSSLGSLNNKPKNCMYPTCIDNSIKKSHIIPKSLVLEKISTNGHFIEPSFNDQSETYSFKKVGINQASTFSGFCEEHESGGQIWKRQKNNITNYY